MAPQPDIIMFLLKGYIIFGGFRKFYHTWALKSLSTTVDKLKDNANYRSASLGDLRRGFVDIYSFYSSNDIIIGKLMLIKIWLLTVDNHSHRILNLPFIRVALLHSMFLKSHQSQIFIC